MSIQYGLLAFATIFLLVGIIRIVEFHGLGFAKSTHFILVGLHILGTCSFCAAMVLLAIDPTQNFKALSTVCFSIGLVLLFPIHIFLAIKRKIRSKS